MLKYSESYVPKSRPSLVRSGYESTVGISVKRLLVDSQGTELFIELDDGVETVIIINYSIETCKQMKGPF